MFVDSSFPLNTISPLNTTCAAIQELQTSPHWVCYRKEERQGRLTKVPYSPLNGRGAQSNVPATWSDYTTAVKALQTSGYDGLGYMFHQDFTGVDLDHCVDAAGVIEPWALKIVRFLDSYTEFSPSGGGVHVLVRGHIPKGVRRFIPPDRHPLQEHAAVEMYCEKRYFTITGRHVPGTPEMMTSRQSQLDILFRRVTLADSPSQSQKNPARTSTTSGFKGRPPGASGPQPLDRPPDPMQDPLPLRATPATHAAHATQTAHTATVVSSQDTSQTSHSAVPAPHQHSDAGPHHPRDLSDEALLQRACAARNGDRFRALYYQGDTHEYPSPSEADMALCHHLAFWTDCDVNRMDSLFRRSALYREKWGSRRNETTYGDETIQRAVKQSVETYIPRSHSHEPQDDRCGHAELLLHERYDDELIEGAGMLEFQHANETTKWLCRPRKVSMHEIISCLDEKELGDAQLFNEAFHNLAWFDFLQKDWYLWRTHTWQRDQGGKAILLIAVVASYYNKAADLLESKQKAILAEIERSKQKHHFAAQDLVERLNQSAQQLATQIKQLRKRADELHMHTRMKSVLSLAEPLMTIKSRDWDQKPFLLPTADGVINLQTGECSDGRPDDYMRISCPTTWTGLDTPCPRWERFLQEIFADKPERDEIISFLQRLLGYGITGSTRDHIFSIFYGPQGRNGKDTLFSIFHHVMGDLANVVSNDIFLTTSYTRSGGSATPHLESLQGMRSAWGSEPNLGDRLDVGQVKHLTGGGDISTRSLYGKAFYSFAPTHKLFMMTNHKLTINASEEPAWERICLLELGMRFIDEPDPNKANERPRDPTLIDALKQERSGILAWLVRGCLDWFKQGLRIPRVLKQATKDYQAEQDLLTLFIDDACHRDPQSHVSATALYNAYKQWHNDTQYGPCMTNTMFGREMSKHFEKGHSNTGRMYVGIGLGYRCPQNEHEQPDEPAESEGCEGYEGFSTTFSDQKEEKNKENIKNSVNNPSYPSHPSQPTQKRFPEIIQAALDFTCDDTNISPHQDDEGYPYDDDDIPSDHWCSEDTWGSSPP